MDHDLLSSAMNDDHKWIRKLIRQYHNETDPTMKQYLMDKMLEVKAKVDRVRMEIDCG
jgi:hypothetical protein